LSGGRHMVTRHTVTLTTSLQSLELVDSLRAEIIDRYT